MFAKILIANDGSDHAFHALSLALIMAKESGAELHMVSIEEDSYLPEIVGEVGEDQNVHALRFHAVVERSRKIAEECGVNLHVHVLPGHPVHRRPCRADESRSACGWRPRPFCSVRAHDWQPRRPHRASGALSGAGGEVSHAIGNAAGAFLSFAAKRLLSHR